MKTISFLIMYYNKIFKNVEKKNQTSYKIL